MVNINKLKGKIIENGLNVEQVAVIVGVDRSTMYRKMEDSGRNMTIKDATILSKALNLSAAEVNSIFFDETVAWNATSGKVIYYDGMDHLDSVGV